MPVILDHGLRFGVHRMVKPILAKSDYGGGSWGWSRDGKRIASISYWVTRQGPQEARLRLSYTRDGEDIAYELRLVGEPCRFGGLRWFAICPATLRKVSKLYLPPGATRFLARKAWRITYASQNIAPGFDRLCDQRDRLLARKLRSDDPDFPRKPKGMRWSTYEKHLDKLDRLQAAMDHAFLDRFGMSPDAILKNAGNFDAKQGE
ncbi:MAG: hypothetical protein IOC64_07635 [Methylobacterium sp.]|nr:hypothetical protein [Methylobacterium sp.]MCA3601601.1 hypothetical protein [Methylobacterium sp.]MCA3606182.1 hypothetical protein [Methylobacterium sp.]MCA3609282.1 hypothetical protein [Methylobacterium sp.]MCA3618381.1 hypothetical protein [Methylobacterium sp.]